MEANNIKPVRMDFLDRLWEESWIYIKTVVDIVREPVLILDKNLCVMEANEPFYQMFHVEKKDTEGKNVYELGNGQWNVPALRKLLEDILPKNTFFKGFEVTHEFPLIGRKVMMLNARELHFKQDGVLGSFPPIILLAIEDISNIMALAHTVSSHANHLKTTFDERTQKLELQVATLEKIIKELTRSNSKLS